MLTDQCITYVYALFYFLKKKCGIRLWHVKGLTKTDIFSKVFT